MKLLVIKDLKISIPVQDGVVHAVRGVDLTLRSGESLGIVGESGSGKSLTMKAIMGLLPENAKAEGEILFFEKNLLTKTEKEFEMIRGSSIALVNQNPASCLNPIIKVGKQMYDAILARRKVIIKTAKKYLKSINKKYEMNVFKMKDDEIAEKLRPYHPNETEFKRVLFSILNNLKAYHTDISKKTIMEGSLELLKEVGIDNPLQRYNQYPFELSGGMRQRIVIAIALSSNPHIIIFDEPTTSLDVITQAQILNLIKKLQKKRGFAYIFVSHNLSVISNIAKRVMVMYAGKIMEEGTVEQVFNNPLHPYTKALFNSLPILEEDKELTSIPGMAPDLLEVKDMDQFAPRNEYPLEIDYQKEPPLFDAGSGHRARTWMLHPLAPKKTPLTKVKKEKKEVESFENKLLQIKDINKTFTHRFGETNALIDVNLDLYEGEILAIVGESGSGKTTLGKIITGLTHQDKGEIRIGDNVLSDVNEKGKYKYHYKDRTQIQMIFQDSLSALDPRLTIGESIAEGLEIKHQYTKEEIEERVIKVMKEVDLDPKLMDRFPSMISGGQRQRVEIARSLIVNPKVLIADEPVSDLDVSIQANVINLFEKIRKDMQISIIFITHNLALVQHFASRVAVMYHGRIVEVGKTKDIFTNYKHPYTKALFSAVPKISEENYENVDFIYDVNKKGHYETDKKGHMVWVNEE